VLDGLATRHDLATARARPPPRTRHSPWPASAILIEQVQYLQRVALVLHVGEEAVPHALRHKQRTSETFAIPAARSNVFVARHQVRESQAVVAQGRTH
jgi:hypothetical protein